MAKYSKAILPIGRDVPRSYPIETDPGDAVFLNVKRDHAAFAK